ncbi:epidermal retinol dehydrogenase 2-like [Brachionus plicatilis]|uniref:Epidermal retinol dehydrogenase 2-like n=1 Tax=Brachionus plicatilis TaxID=10195 RepID=A0A3M7T3P0_BRAPC|nr:epidermal retinol dehydrogenase 2-like [Brachionus plicatilis]
MIQKILLNILTGLYLLLHGIISGIVKQVLPYTYRCKSVKNELVLVTGSGSGIGKLMAKKFALLGAKIICVDINQTANSKTCAEIKNEGGEAVAFKCDLSKREEIYSLADNVIKNVGYPDILINNAGIVTGKKFLDSPDEMIEKTFQVNTLSHFWLAKKFLPNMIEKNHGHLVTIASCAGMFGAAGLVDYCSSKFAAVGFDEALRNELLRIEKTGVKTTVVCPNVINTGMFQGFKVAGLPLLEPEYVADKVVEAVLTNQELLMLPRMTYFLWCLKTILPYKFASFLDKDVMRLCHSMDQFVGRKSD